MPRFFLPAAVTAVFLCFSAPATGSAQQHDDCSPFLYDEIYYQRCLQIQQQSDRIRNQQQQRNERLQETRERRRAGLHRSRQTTPQMNVPDAPEAAETKAAAAATAQEKAAQEAAARAARRGGFGTIGQSQNTGQAHKQAEQQDISAAVAGKGAAGYIVIDPAKLTVEQLQIIQAVLKQVPQAQMPQAQFETSAPLAVVPQAAVPQAVAPRVTAPDLPQNPSLQNQVQMQAQNPEQAARRRPARDLDSMAAQAPKPFSQEGDLRRIRLPDIGTGEDGYLDVEPVDPLMLWQQR
ncbi:MAG: hypothetical protein EA357_02175 [Micavibrio sp.]|nr:MAG: hypothetical protein EA357_02175 [Micavibrio sp.]